ncbi:uncharacterized protein BKA55DRAFT_562481 [Fusarium redolens]|uniref:Uncharacterized protein n=1 Tax=Fusarium redolens TaxID=48865 RepID=A0A9P9KJI1_FUSRE|nr:uncharacterized protein BKA55DRAFT_562481 [Fusarium redolens]KAH7259391.1 hypothetical protein BKA55DRAFT_562481 [Fusarium redolens]
MKFGYTYTETKPWTFTKPEDYRKGVYKQRETMYPTYWLPKMKAATQSQRRHFKHVRSLLVFSQWRSAHPRSWPFPLPKLHGH